MAKQVSLAGGRLKVNETALAVLVRIAKLDGGPGKPAVVSSSTMGREVGCSTVTAYRSIYNLEQKGLLTSDERYSEDGARLSNAYSLTLMGALVAESIHAQRFA